MREHSPRPAGASFAYGQKSLHPTLPGSEQLPGLVRSPRPALSAWAGYGRFEAQVFREGGCRYSKADPKSDRYIPSNHSKQADMESGGRSFSPVPVVFYYTHDS